MITEVGHRRIQINYISAMITSMIEHIAIINLALVVSLAGANSDAAEQTLADLVLRGDIQVVFMLLRIYHSFKTRASKCVSVCLQNRFAHLVFQDGSFSARSWSVIPRLNRLHKADIGDKRVGYRTRGSRNAAFFWLDDYCFV